MIRYSRLVGALPAVVPFVPPEAFERRLGAPIKIRIGANESAFGPSPKAIAAINAGAPRISWYCDPEGYELREALAKHHGVARENIGLGIGADDVLCLCVRSVIDPGDPVVMSHGAYPTFAFHVNGYGGKFVTPPYRDFKNDAQALADAAAKSRSAHGLSLQSRQSDRLMAPAEEQMAIVAKLAPGAVLVLDEAYSDFAPPDSMPMLDPEDERVIRVRTFSKAHGMAGARVGYAIASKAIIASFDKIRHHFGVTRLSQEAALASLGDQAFIADVVRQVERRPARLRRARRKPRPHARCPRPRISSPSIWAMATAPARPWRQLLEDEGVFLRMPGVAPLDRLIRVTVGTRPERQGFAAALKRVVAAA